MKSTEIVGLVFGIPFAQSISFDIPGRGDIEIEAEEWQVIYTRKRIRSRLSHTSDSYERGVEITEEGIQIATFTFPYEMRRHCREWAQQSDHDKILKSGYDLAFKRHHFDFRFEETKELKRQPQWPFTAQECSLQAHLLKHSD